MPVKALITDPTTGRQVSVVNAEEKNGLVVATRPLKSFYNRIKFFTHPDYGYNMNIAAGFGGTPVYIHNGIDVAHWTASVISGFWTFNSTDQAHGGTRSIDGSSTFNNHTAQIAKGSSIDLSDYVAVTGWVYLSSWDDRGTKGIQLYGWDTAAAAMVGNEVNLKNYTNIGLLGSWQKFVVPLAHMALIDKAIDAIRIKTVDIGWGFAPNYYLDDIQLEETGIPVEFNIEPESGTWLHVCRLDLLFVDAYASILANATMPYLSYDKLLGVSSLINGLLYQGIIGGKLRLTFPFKNLGELLAFPGLKIECFGSDGTNTFLKLSMGLVEPVILQSKMEDKLLFVVMDDLSGFLKLNISAACRAEIRE